MEQHKEEIIEIQSTVGKIVEIETQDLSEFIMSSAIIDNLYFKFQPIKKTPKHEADKDAREILRSISRHHPEFFQLYFAHTYKDLAVLYKTTKSWLQLRGWTIIPKGKGIITSLLAFMLRRL